MPVNIEPGRLAAQLTSQALVLVKQNSSDVVPGRIGGVQALVCENLDYSVIEMHLAPERQVQDFLTPPYPSETRGLLVLTEGQEALIFNNSVRILEVADEVNDRTMGLSHIPPQPASQLLIKDALRLCRS